MYIFIKYCFKSFEFIMPKAISVSESWLIGLEHIINNIDSEYNQNQ